MKSARGELATNSEILGAGSPDLHHKEESLVHAVEAIKSDFLPESADKQATIDTAKRGSSRNYPVRMLTPPLQTTHSKIKTTITGEVQQQIVELEIKIVIYPKNM